MLLFKLNTFICIARSRRHTHTAPLDGGGHPPLQWSINDKRAQIHNLPQEETILNYYQHPSGQGSGWEWGDWASVTNPLNYRPHPIPLTLSLSRPLLLWRLYLLRSFNANAIHYGGRTNQIGVAVHTHTLHSTPCLSLCPESGQWVCCCCCLLMTQFHTRAQVQPQHCHAEYTKWHSRPPMKRRRPWRMTRPLLLLLHWANYESRAIH